MRHTTRRTARPVTRPIRRRRPSSSPLPLILVALGIGACGLIAWLCLSPDPGRTATSGSIGASDQAVPLERSGSDALLPPPREPDPPIRAEPIVQPNRDALATAAESRRPGDPHAVAAGQGAQTPALVVDADWSTVKLEGVELCVWPADPKWGQVSAPGDPGPASPTKDGKLTIPTTSRLAGKSGLQFAYRIPVDEDGSPLATAARMVFYGPWIHQGLDSISSIPWLKDLSESERLTVFTVQLPGPYDTEDKSTFYAYRESGWFDAVFEAQKRIAEIIGCPPRPIVVTGDSAGGSLGQQLAASEPLRVCAAVFGGGGMFSEVRAPTPHLVLSTLGDANNSACRALVEGMDRTMAKAVFQIADREGAARSRPHYEHTTGPLGRKLMGAYAAGAAKEPDSAKWPYRIDVGRGTGPFKVGSPPRATWRDALGWTLSRHPLVPGNECAGAGVAPLPSQAVADLISRMPAAYQGTWSGDGGAPCRFIVTGPVHLGVDELCGVVVYRHPYSADAEGVVVENCMRLAQSGIMAICPFDPAVPEAADSAWWSRLADELKARTGRDVGELRVLDAWEKPDQRAMPDGHRRVVIDAGGRSPSGGVGPGAWISARMPLQPNSGREWDAALRLAIVELGGKGRWNTLP